MSVKVMLILWLTNRIICSRSRIVQTHTIFNQSFIHMCCTNALRKGKKKGKKYFKYFFVLLSIIINRVGVLQLCILQTNENIIFSFYPSHQEIISEVVEPSSSSTGSSYFWFTLRNSLWKSVVCHRLRGPPILIMNFTKEMISCLSPELYR